MENTVSRIPQYPTVAPMRGTTIRITEKQRANIARIVKATNAQSIGASVRLLITEEINAVNKGQRQPDDYIPTNDPKLYTLGFKVSESDRQSLDKLRTFYHAPSTSDTVCYLMNQVISELEKVGA